MTRIMAPTVVGAVVAQVAALLWGVVLAGGVIGAVAGPVEPDRPTVRACTTEDDPGPCAWDAGRQGNGLGRSFEVLPDGTRRYR